MNPSVRIKIILAFAAIYIVWGSSYYAVRLALQGFPPFTLSALRFLIGGTTLLLFCIVKKEKFPAKHLIVKNAVSGLVIFIGGVVAVVWAQQYISSSLASIIITTPFWFIVLDKKQWPFYFSNKFIIGGLITGLAGVIILLGFKKGHAGNGTEFMQLVSILIMIAGSLMWVSGSLYLRYRPSASSVYVNTCIQLLSAGICCTIISWFCKEPQQIMQHAVPLKSWLSLLYLAIVSTMITFMAFVWLLTKQPPALVSTYAYVNPLVAVLLGWAIGGEKITSLQILALVIILSGVLLVNIPRYRTVKAAS
ncbi:MAG: EamA family transporter [Bacteroidetes bacterium]|nr:EamA family transporter [Bacteroidota bacterium]